MAELFTVFRRECIYIWYYFEIQFRQICRYWILGMLIGSFMRLLAHVWDPYSLSLMSWLIE